MNTRNVPWCLAAAGVLSLCGSAFAQTGYSITGGLSNFDVHNQCDDDCDEFEIEIEDSRPEDILGCYHNGNYGAPRVLLSSDGTFTIVDYRNPNHLTHVGAIEHFGVSLRSLSPTSVIRVRWMRNGAPATVHGQVPVPGGTAPATQPVMPSITAEMGTTPEGEQGVVLGVTNNDPTQSIWIKRRAQLYVGRVALESLMTDNPIITSTIAIDSVPMLIGPGQTVGVTNDLVEVEDNQSVVFAAQYFQDITGSGPFNTGHARGPELGNVMTAALASPESGCEYSRPVIFEQPQSTDAPEGRTVNLRVDADGNDMPLSYGWLKDGQPLVESSMYRGVNTDELSIEELTSANEGFYSVRISNSCGTVISSSALVFVTGHNQVRAPLGANLDPSEITASAGDSISIMGNASYAPAGTTFQWKLNGHAISDGPGGASPAGGFVTGASGTADSLPTTLTIDGAAVSDAGSYTISFTNAAGTATSAACVVSFSQPCGLTIDSQPQPAEGCLQSPATFTIAATGADPVSYEWQLETDPDVWYTLGTDQTQIACSGGGDGSAYVSAANSASVQIGVNGCTGFFGVRCVVSDACDMIASDPTFLIICPGDFNCDGGIDGGDVESFFSAWEAGDGSADINTDGGIDGSDVEYFFGHWEAGC